MKSKRKQSNQIKKTSHIYTKENKKAEQPKGFLDNPTKTFNKPAGYGNCRTLPKKNWQQNLGGFGRYVKTA